MLGSRDQITRAGEGYPVVGEEASSTRREDRIPPNRPGGYEVVPAETPDEDTEPSTTDRPKTPDEAGVPDNT